MEFRIQELEWEAEILKTEDWKRRKIQGLIQDGNEFAGTVNSLF